MKVIEKGVKNANLSDKLNSIKGVKNANLTNSDKSNLWMGQTSLSKKCHTQTNHQAFQRKMASLNDDMPLDGQYPPLTVDGKCQDEDEGEDGRSVEGEETKIDRPVEGQMMGAVAVGMGEGAEETEEGGRSVEEEETEIGRPVEGQMMGDREDKTATKPTYVDAVGMGEGEEETEEGDRPVEEEVTKIGRPVEGVMMMGAQGWSEEDSDGEMEAEMVKLQIKLEEEREERLRRAEKKREEEDQIFLLDVSKPGAEPEKQRRMRSHG